MTTRILLWLVVTMNLQRKACVVLNWLANIAILNLLLLIVGKALQVVTMNLQRKAMCGFKLVSKYSNIKFVTTYCGKSPAKPIWAYNNYAQFLSSLIP